MSKQWNIDHDAPRSTMQELRTSIRDELDRLGADPVGDGELLAWELVTNAVRHASGPIAVLVLAYDGRVRVEVLDGAPAHPTLRDPDPERIGGHGIELVDQLSVDWGEDSLGRGKAVWFDVAGPSGTGPEPSHASPS